MSGFFELDPSGFDRMVADGRYDPAALPADEPGFTEGFLKGKEMGAMKGFARLGQAAAVGIGGSAARGLDLAQNVGDILDTMEFDAQGRQIQKPQPSHTDFQDALFSATDEHVNSAVDFWTPDARTVGTLGRVWGGLNEGLVPLAAGAGNPVPLIATQELGTSIDLVRQGVDANTAVEAGIVQGTAAAVGMKFPFGKTIAQRVTSGALGNVGTNMAATFAQQKLLEGGGYEELAKRYDPLDAEGRIVDLLMGTAFGVLPAEGSVEITPTQRAAILATADARHFQVDTAPGRPLDVAASQAHQRAMETALEQMDTGEPVSVPPEVLTANFEPRPAVDPAEVEAAVREVLGEPPAEMQPAEPRNVDPFVFEADTNLSDAARAIETRMGAEIARDLRGAEARYAALPDTRGGKVLNTDTARELSSDYLKDRTQSAAVHEPASAFIKRLYAQKLAEQPKPGELPTVLFTAGGTGAGKTTAIQNALGTLADAAQIVYDTNMNGVSSSIKKIDQALAAGKNATIVYTFREPIAALREGALPRAMRQEKEFGSGRTVPVDEHLKTHIGARESMERIAAHYAGDNRVQLIVIDNTGGRGKAKTVPLGSIPKFNDQAYNSLREQAVRTLDEERAAGRISEAVHRGFAPVERPAAESLAPGLEQAGGRGTREESQPQHGEVTAPRLEPTGSKTPPKPGQPFLVMRLGTSGKLENRNAGNAQSVAHFLAHMDDPESARPAGAEKSDTINVIEVTTPTEFGKYELGSKGADMKESTVGRRDNRDGISYSFPAGAKFEAKTVLSIPLAEVRAAIKKRAGTDSFDDLGSLKGAQELERIVAERTAPTKSVATATGRKLEVRPKVIELADAVTSDRPEYPQELQPRQRGARKALDSQVQDIAQNLDPARLGDSAEADRGAPITGDGNIVESGNGRVMVLKYAYENLPKKAAEYRKFLESQGYDIEGMKQPVLVRERVTPLDAKERRAFTVEANQAATAALSPVERAQADARLFDAGTMSQLRGGDLALTQNADFVRSFIERLPTSERNAMLNPDGTVSQEGVRRIQGALLAKAYGGTAESNVTLGRMLESTDTEMRSALGALLDAAPAFARLRQAIVDGKIPGEYDIAPFLTQAIENVAKLRLTGQSLRDFLAQGDMLTARAPIVDELMKQMFDRAGVRMAGREKIATALTKYAGQAARQRLDQSSLFAEPPVSPDKLLSKASEAENAPAPKVTDMFGLRTPQAPEAVAAVREMLAERDVQVATGATDAEGNAITRSGREVMAEADAAVAKAEADAVGIEAAVGCLITRGLDAA